MTSFPIQHRAGTLAALAMLLFVPLAQAEPLFPAVASSGISPELKGQVLIEELNCTACHEADVSLAARSKKAPRLADVGSRLNPQYIEAFIRDPHGAKPGTPMPDLRAGADEAKALTHFLLSLKKNDFSPQAPDAVAAEQGRLFFHSRGCAACHSPRDEKGAETLASTSVPLGALEGKYSFKSLVDFLRRPHASRPSGRMPDMRLSGQDLDRIAHFLLKDTQVPGSLAYTLFRGDVWEGIGSEKVTAERAGHVEDFALERFKSLPRHSAIRYDGWINVPRAGKHSFFLTMNGGSLLLDEKSVVAEEPSDRRGVKRLEGSADLTAGLHKLQLTYYHTGREPQFALEMAGPDRPRAPISAAMLSVSREPVAVFEPLKVDPALAARGREQFSKLGCANCHDDLKAPRTPATPFAKLEAGRGCLSENDGSWPRFGLSAEQRALIAKALPSAASPHLDDKQQLQKSLVTFNCIACHERAGVGGVAPERNPHFTGTQPGLGDQGRLPPPLTYVGAKLRPEWLADVLLRGRRQREYVDASMPQFGEENVGHLVELFGKVDKLEPVALPKVGDILESKNAGYEMIGINGLGCIACHEFNGQKAGEMSALDIGHVTERLQKNWFFLYMRQPSRFHPTVIMPSFWPDGKSTRPSILGGDTPQQIEALWTYLSDGPRAKKPAGLSRQSNELRVADTTEICRGQSPVGYRGIAVGYPERVNLTFDSGEMALRQLWKGEFANVDLGRFQPRGTDMINFPPGIPFHRLASMDDHWPYKGKTNYTFPQDQGYQFRGYHLDAARKPTFLYRYGDIAVEDYFEDVLDANGRAFIKRTLRFDAPAAQTQFHFRVATGGKVTAQTDRAFTADKLQVRITGDYPGIVRDGDPAEVLIPLTLPKGRTTLTLEYQW